MATKGIAVLGSTGSVGRQTLDVIDEHPDLFHVVALAGGNNIELLAQQALKFNPSLVVARTDDQIAGFRTLRTPEGLTDAAAHPDVDIVVAATSGHDAIRATRDAIVAGKTIALANKEAIICAAEIILPLARQHDVEIRPVDSEHSAIWQSLGGVSASAIRRLTITASGGPFRQTPSAELGAVTVQQALAHPRWSMGPKISIDSATLVNKGLEVIEAHWLFDVPFDDIEVVVHPESIVHSMVEFRDGSTIAQLSPPDMRLPILYALTHPEHVPSAREPLDLMAIGALTFELPDHGRFPALRVCEEVGRNGQTYGTVLSAVDDVAVKAFISGRIGYPGIVASIEHILDRHKPEPVTSLDQIAAVDTWARAEAEAWITAHLLQG